MLNTEKYRKPFASPPGMPTIYENNWSSILSISFSLLKIEYNVNWVSFLLIEFMNRINRRNEMAAPSNSLANVYGLLNGRIAASETTIST